MAKEIEIENEEEIDNLSIMTEEKEEEKNNNSDNDLNNVFEDNKIIDAFPIFDTSLAPKPSGFRKNPAYKTRNNKKDNV